MLGADVAGAAALVARGKEKGHQGHPRLYMGDLTPSLEGGEAVVVVLAGVGCRRRCSVARDGWGER